MAAKQAQTVRRKKLTRTKARRAEVVIAFSPDALAVGRRFPLDGTRVVLGRDVEGPGQISDPAMSRRHAVLAPDEGANYSIEDLGGSNGTFVDGVRLEASRDLDPHQVISVGETLLVVDLEPKLEQLPTAPDADESLVPELVGESLGAQMLRKSLATVAAEGTVLLLGGTGSGKEVSARAIHQASGRTGQLVAVNCAAIPSELAEAELFGHSAGAFTGATTAREGHFVESDGGTLFLDEVGDLPPEVQAKLLRVLEQGEVKPIGGGPTRRVDLRVVAATHKNLEGEAFRKDLYARLGDWVLRLPPLAERKVDVLVLWDHFTEGGLSRTPSEVAEGLLLHDWPMNVRELAKLAQRTVRLFPEGEITIEALPEALQKPILDRFEETDEPEPEPPAEDLGEGAPSRDELRAALVEAKGNVKELAIARGWHRTQVYRWLRRARLDPKNFR